MLKLLNHNWLRMSLRWNFGLEETHDALHDVVWKILGDG